MTNVLKNYKPVSDLSFMSKLLLEKVVQDRLQAFLDSSGLMSCAQFAYWKYRSMETMIKKGYNDLLLAADQGQVSALVLCLLELTTAFHTMDHELLLLFLECQIMWCHSAVVPILCQTDIMPSSTSSRVYLKHAVTALQGHRCWESLFRRVNHASDMTSLAIQIYCMSM